MDCLWLFGLLGWVTGCFHTRRKYAGCFAARNRTHGAAQPLLSILKSHEFPPTVLKFNPTSRLLISGSADNTVRLIAVPDGLGDTCTFYLHVILLRIGFMVLPSIVSVVELCSPDNSRSFYRTIRRCMPTRDEWCYLILFSFLHPP